MSSAGTSSGRVQSAVLIPVPQADSVVGRWRYEHDPVAAAGVPAHVTLVVPWLPPDEIGEEDLAAAGVPAHVTLVVPWLPPDEIGDEDLAELEAEVADVHAFDFTLARVDWFGRRVLWIAPEPAEPFLKLTHRLAERFHTPPWDDEFDEVIPHLTVAHASDGVELVPVAADVATRLPLRCRAQEIWVMVGGGGRWDLRHRIVLAD